MKPIIELALEEAFKVLDLCATNHGFHAAFPGYDAVWARDSMITSLGASLSPRYRETFRQSLITLSKNQAKNGQIPNAVDKFSKRKPHVDFASVDSTLWFLIGHKTYQKRFNSELYTKYKKQIASALNWLSFQDVGNDLMIDELPTTDWEDAFPHKYGNVMHAQSLYYYVLNLYGKKSLAQKLKNVVNLKSDKSLWQGSYYYAWRWKNHNKYREMGDFFDSLANILAIIFNLADSQRSNKILSYIEKNKINHPYPVKAIYPPITPKSSEWHDYFRDCEARTAYHYLNAGIWTYIGAFYVLALIKMKKFSKASSELEQLAIANLQEPKYNEWLNGKTGKPGASASGQNGNQAWNAGAFILAYESLKQKKVLLPGL